jgi:hypothetical protein
MASGLTFAQIDVQETAAAVSADVEGTPSVESFGLPSPICPVHAASALAGGVKRVPSDLVFELTDDWLDHDDSSWEADLDCRVG